MTPDSQSSIYNEANNPPEQKQRKELSKDKKPEPPQTFWRKIRNSVMLNMVGGGIDTIGFIALFGFFTNHVTGNLVLAGAGWVEGDEGIWIKLAAIPLFIVTVALTKYFIDRSDAVNRKAKVLSYLFLIEAAFLLAFMLAGLYFEPFSGAGSVTVAITGALGLIALAIRNTSSKTLMKKLSPSTIMTGNSTELGMNISNYLSEKSDKNAQELKESFLIVLSFVIGAALGAVLYVNLKWWSVAFFILPELYMAYLSKTGQFLTDDELNGKG